ANLPRCLESLKAWVDEIVVVDTGSTDNTVAIAESFGAKVFHFPGCDDFAAARNESLAHATSDWVLVVDADEELVVQEADALRDALRHDAIGGYVVQQRNEDAEGRLIPNPVLRLFRRDPLHQFSGRLHEDVTPSLNTHGRAIGELSAIALLHRGYLPEAIAAKGKWDRNMRISIAQVESEPQNAEAWYNLGRSSLYLGREELSIEAFGHVERLLSVGAALAEGKRRTWALLHQQLLARRGREVEALALLDHELARNPEQPELLYERGLLRARQGDIGEARRNLEASLQMLDQAPSPRLGRDRVSQALAELGAAHRA
ncbi:MAG: glycosyltransferase, partial [Candidatus Sericytochromatia bacterium]